MATREEKATAVAEIGTELEDRARSSRSTTAASRCPRPPSCASKLREADASFSIVKNRLAKRATEGAGASDLDEHLVGPTALTFVRGDAVTAAKAISDFIKQNGVLTYKGGMMDGAALDPDQFQRDRPPPRRRRPARPAGRPRRQPADRDRPDAEPADRRHGLPARPDRRAGTGQRRGPGRRARRGGGPAAEEARRRARGRRGGRRGSRRGRSSRRRRPGRTPRSLRSTPSPRPSPRASDAPEQPSEETESEPRRDSDGREGELERHG